MALLCSATSGCPWPVAPRDGCCVQHGAASALGSGWVSLLALLGALCWVGGCDLWWLILECCSPSWELSAAYGEVLAPLGALSRGKSRFYDLGCVKMGQG